jgi:hypothetical protein
MKALGYEGVYATPGSNMDNSTYGTVIYEVKPGAAEQRVVGPEIAKVLQRYEFTPNNSLKNAGLAPELNRNLKRFGFGVKQYGTRMNDFRVIALDTGRAVEPNKIIEEGLAEGRAIAEQQRAFEAEQRARELEQRIIEIYNADERPYTGKDFEDRGVEQKVVVEVMAEPGTIEDLVARGRDRGVRDSQIRALLLKRFGKESSDAIDAALEEYFDMFTGIPEAFGNVEGGITVGREIFESVKREINEFSKPKAPQQMTKRQREDRIAELRAKFPDQKNLSDTALLRKHPRQRVAPSMGEVRAEALNLLRSNALFNEQTTEVQEQLLLAFDKTFKTRANKQVNTLISQIRNNISQRRRGVSNANRVRNELKKMLTELLPAGKYTKAEAKAITTLVNNVTEANMLVQIEKLMDLVDKKAKADINAELQDIMKLDRRIRSERKYAEREVREIQKNLRRLVSEVLPRADYTKAEAAKLAKLVNEVNEKNYDKKAEEVLKLVDKKREQIRRSLITDMKRFVQKASQKYKTESGRVRTRNLDAPGQAYFEALLPVLDAAADFKDRSKIQKIAQDIASDPNVDAAVAKYMAGESLTSREQALVDTAAALDLVSNIADMSLEEVEAVLEDLKIAAGFSRVSLKNTRLARAAQYAAMNSELDADIRDAYPFLSDEQGEALNRNQISARRKQINAAWNSPGFKSKIDAIKKTFSFIREEGFTPLLKGIGSHVVNLGAVTKSLSDYLYENIYNETSRMNERYQKGVLDQKIVLDRISSSIDGVKNYNDIVSILFDNAQPMRLELSRRYTSKKEAERRANKLRKKYPSKANLTDEELLMQHPVRYDEFLNKDELLRVYALYKNDTQRQKLVDQGFTEEVMAEVEQYLGSQLMEFSDKMVDYLSNDYYEQVNDVFKKVNDVSLGFVENYFPTRTITGKVQQGLLTGEVDFQKVFDAETSPAFKERNDVLGEVDISEGLSFAQTLNNHIEQMERYKAYAEGTKRINVMFQNQYLDALANSLHANSTLREMVNQSINPDSYRRSFSSPLMEKAYRNFSMKVLAFKFFQIPKQMSSFVTAFENYNKPGVPRVLELPLFILEYGLLVGELMAELATIAVKGTSKGPVSEAVGISGEFARRLEQFKTGNVYSLESGVSTFRSPLKRETFLGKVARYMRTAAGAPTFAGDIGGVLGYLVTYRNQIKNGVDPELALQNFNDYNQTQQSRRPGDAIPLQYKGNVYTRGLIQFSSSLFSLFNKAIISGVAINRSYNKSRKQGKNMARSYMDVPKSDKRAFFMSLVGAQIAFAAVSNVFLLTGDDEDRKRYLLKMATAPLNALFMVPFVGSAIEDMMNEALYGYRPQGVGGTDPIGRTVNDIKRAYNNEEYVRVATEALELVIGTNFDPFLGLYDLGAGEEPTEALYDIAGVPKSQRPK